MRVTSPRHVYRWAMAGVCAVLGMRGVSIHAQTAPADCERRFTERQIISTEADGARFVFAVDLDGDGDIDALSASFEDGKIAWYENTDGRGTFGPQKVITTEAIGAWSVFAIDLDGDGDADVLSASFTDDTITWYENTDGLGNFGPPQDIITTADGARSVFAADLDGDGDNDVISASFFDQKIAWYENIDGLGTFGSQQVIIASARGAQSVFVADVDGDGDNDVLSASFGDDKIAWYENTDGSGTFGPQQIIAFANGASSVFAVDMDGDSDIDILWGSFLGKEIAWNENIDSLGTFGPKQTIAMANASVTSIIAQDFDGDGDVDVVSALSNGDKIAWYENTNGLGMFGPQLVITTAADSPTSIYAADFNGDGTIDVLSASRLDDKIAWYANETDCNVNGVNDGCDLTMGTSMDCNNNGRPDECDVSNNSNMDCNNNGVPDQCDLADNPDYDCNDNGKLDDCDIADETSRDCNTNSIPDECEPGCNLCISPDECERQFLPPELITSSGRFVTAKDLDGDEDVDVLVIRNDSSISWFKNIDGLGNFQFGGFIPTSDDFTISTIFLADLDSDGDTDILATSFSNSKIGWFENTDGMASFGQLQVISDVARGVSFIFAVDLDNDGDTDIISARTFRDDSINWYENTDGLGTFVLKQEIASQFVIDRVTSIFAADLDNDGDIDVLSTSAGDRKIAWYENTDGQGTFRSQHIITTALGLSSLFAADMNGDGSIDIVTASRDPNNADWNMIAWYPNLDGLGTFGEHRVITTCTTFAAFTFFPADLDGDGDLDVISGTGSSDRTLAWYENSDGLGTFGPRRVISTDVRIINSVFASDIDGDGDLDVLSADSLNRKIAWFENDSDCNFNNINDGCDLSEGTSLDCNNNGQPDDCEPRCHSNGRPDECNLEDGTSVDCNHNNRPDVCDIFDGISLDCNGNGVPDECDVEPEFSGHIITTTAKGANDVFVADLDGDGDSDVLSASGRDGMIAWYENTDGQGTFGPQQVITISADGAHSVFAADLDGDGDIDVLSASERDHKISWYQNTDGMGTFSPQIIITTEAALTKDVYAADLDGDGDIDVLSVSVLGIAWYENTDGLGSFGQEKIISTSINFIFSVYAADLDGDSDIDVLSASLLDNKIAWYENTDGKGSFGTEQIITTEAIFASSVFAADINGDGYIDVLSASFTDHTIAWYENTDGLGMFGPQQIITVSARGAFSVFAIDMDGDGDTDVLSATRPGEIAWYENIDGQGGFSPGKIITVLNSARSVIAVDLDKDGNMDVLTTSFGDNEIAWYENIRFSQDCNDNDLPDECDVYLEGGGESQDCNNNIVPDECELDGDGDGLVDGCDLCLNSLMDETLVVGNCETGIENFAFDDGCTMADLIHDCEKALRNHGDFSSCVAGFARQWMQDRFITGREQGLIVSCIAKSAWGRQGIDQSSIRKGKKR